MDILNIIFGIIGAIGAGFSIYGAVRSTKASKKAKGYVEEIEAKKIALDLGRLKVNLDNLHKEIYELMNSKRLTRSCYCNF